MFKKILLEGIKLAVGLKYLKLGYDSKVGDIKMVVGTLCIQDEVEMCIHTVGGGYGGNAISRPGKVVPKTGSLV